MRAPQLRPERHVAEDGSGSGAVRVKAVCINEKGVPTPLSVLPGETLRASLFLGALPVDRKGRTAPAPVGNGGFVHTMDGEHLRTAGAANLDALRSHARSTGGERETAMGGGSFSGLKKAASTAGSKGAAGDDGSDDSWMGALYAGAGDDLAEWSYCKVRCSDAPCCSPPCSSPPIAHSITPSSLSPRLPTSPPRVRRPSRTARRMATFAVAAISTCACPTAWYRGALKPSSRTNHLRCRPRGASSPMAS